MGNARKRAKKRARDEARRRGEPTATRSRRDRFRAEQIEAGANSVPASTATGRDKPSRGGTRSFG